jgi:hypothetical protein
LINYLDFVTLKHGDINELAGIVTAALFDNQQPRRDDLQHKTGLRQTFSIHRPV